MCWCAVRMGWDESWVGCVGIDLVWIGVRLEWVRLRLDWSKIGFVGLDWYAPRSDRKAAVTSSVCVASIGHGRDPTTRNNHQRSVRGPTWIHPCGVGVGCIQVGLRTSSVKWRKVTAPPVHGHMGFLTCHVLIAVGVLSHIHGRLSPDAPCRCANRRE